MCVCVCVSLCVHMLYSFVDIIYQQNYTKLYMLYSFVDIICQQNYTTCAHTVKHTHIQRNVSNKHTMLVRNVPEFVSNLDNIEPNVLYGRGILLCGVSRKTIMGINNSWQQLDGTG